MANIPLRQGIRLTGRDVMQDFGVGYGGFSFTEQQLREPLAGQEALQALQPTQAPTTGMQEALGLLLDKVATLEAKVRAIEAKL